MTLASNAGPASELLDLEPEIAAVLARRRRMRLNGVYKPKNETQIQPLLQSFVQSQPGFEGQTVSNVARLSGGASKEQFRFDVSLAQGGTERFVMRMDPMESVVETSRIREFEALRAFEGIVPVPHAQWIDADGAHFGAPCLITSFVHGATKPSGAPVGNVSGLGINVGAPWRETLGDQFLEHLVAIHAFRWGAGQLNSYAVPSGDPQQAARRQVNWWTQVWLEDTVDHNPIVAAAEGWLRDNLPACDTFVFCHNDYRSGNYLIDEEHRRIAAILDWEMAHLGDFHDDLSGVIVKVFGHLDETGKFLVSGLMPREQFLDRYAKATGRTINPKTLHFYEVLNNYKSMVIILATAYRIAVEGHNHQNVLQTWLVPCGHVFLAEICRLIDKGPTL